MPEYSGSGDPKRSMELLWGRGKAPTRGPRQGLDVERIAAAAMAVADAGGLGALSMRRVAEALGVGTMSLYTYVPGKPELIDVMLDRVAAEQTEPVRAAAAAAAAAPDDAGAWRAALEVYARTSWELLHRHPWVLEISGTRAALGPNELDVYEAAHRGIAHLDVSGRDRSRVVNVVAGYVAGAARLSTDAMLAEQRTGISDDDWWNARSPILDEVMTDERYPALAKLALDGAHEQEPDADPRYLVEEARRDFEFGLARLLDGIAAFVAGTAGP
jgi:AcrR family transcriptional regulator